MAERLRSTSVRDRAAACFGRVPLLVGAVARADERSREDRAESERLALLAEPTELVRMHPAVDPGVLCARLQVLADRDNVDAMFAEVADRLDVVVEDLGPGVEDRAQRLLFDA